MIRRQVQKSTSIECIDRSEQRDTSWSVRFYWLAVLLVVVEGAMMDVQLSLESAVLLRVADVRFER